MHETKQITDYTKKRRGRAIWNRILTVLICAVVFCTTYALILPAVTKEGETFCGKEEHTHTEDCYASASDPEESDADPEPICGLEETEGHTHTENCYLPAHTHTGTCYTETEPVLTCEIPERHTHGTDCYEITETCICGQEESEGHTHTEGCFDAETGELLCDLAESEGHAHTETCDTTTETLICTIPEGHTHTGNCYTAGQATLTCGLEERAERELICTQKEGEGHTHTEACFPQEDAESDADSDADSTKELICDLEEHTHTLICYSNPEADVETAAVWEKTFADVELTGNWAEDVLAIAKTQLGYQESTRNYDVTEDNKIKGYTRYGAWYGDPYGDWCAMFVSFCLHYAELDEAGMPLDANCEHWIQTLTEEGIYEKAEAYTPKPGDLVFIDWNDDDKAEHIGLVAEVTEETDEAPTAIRTIEGNASDTVKYVDYKLTDAKLLGYGVMPENPEFLETTAVTAEQKQDKNNRLTPIRSADTKDIVEINLYDYGTNINENYQKNKNYPGFQQDNGTKELGETLSQYGYNFGNNITADLNAGQSNVTNQGGDINTTTNGANSPISGAMSNTLINGYPALSDGTSLEYLFSNNTYAMKMNTANINGLFQYNSTTGAYTFNSRTNHAQFDQANNTFTLYNEIITSNFIMYPFGNFLPFNDINTQCTQASTIDGDYFQTIAASAAYKYNNSYNERYKTLATVLDAFDGLMDETYRTNWTAADAANAYFAAAGINKAFKNSDLTNIYSIDYDEETNFYFGMEIKMNFLQPKGGITGLNNDQQMVFYFTGDDDVWVYVDDVLFLDLSGIHRHVGGEIDFVNGEIKYYNLDKTTGDVATTPYKTVSFEDVLEAAGKGTDSLNETGTFKNYTTHSFNFYYMERGAGSGVCRMNFNFPLLKQNTISVSKEVSSDALVLGDPDYKFQVLKADENGNKTSELFISAGTSYTIYSITSGEKVGTGMTDENGVFTLKADQRAEFTGLSENSGKYYVRELLDETVVGQYGEITVSGEAITTENNVTVGSETFTGADSPVKDISDGVTVFLFDNTVAEEKLGSLSIQKQLTPYPKERSTKTFDIAVTLDGTPLPVGTTYTVGSETRTVQNAGIITISADETAVISRILAGTAFTVQETTNSAAGYTVTYTTPAGTVFETQNGQVVGTIQLNTTVEMIVTNAEQGTSIEIPGTKAMTAYDGAEHTYEFQLTEVTDQTGSDHKADGLTQTVSATVADRKVDFSFQIDYVYADLSSSPTTYYYKITELSAVDTLPNDTFYVVAVTVTEQDGTLTAVRTGLWKNGESVTDATASADFTNTLVGSLRLSKTVAGSEDAKQQDFTFTITLNPGNSGLDELPTAYPAQHTNAAGETTEKTINFENGVATVTLKHGETLTISGIPYGAVWTITESAADGFRVTTKVNETDGSGTETSGSITTTETAVAYTNTQGYELPQTGGSGIQRYTMAGLMLTLCSAVCLLYRKHRRETT